MGYMHCLVILTFDIAIKNLDLEHPVCASLWVFLTELFIFINFKLIYTQMKITYFLKILYFTYYCPEICKSDKIYSYD